MNVLLWNIDVIEQMLVHEANIALQFEGLHGIVFVKVERQDVFERQPFFSMHPDQFGINANWC